MKTSLLLIALSLATGSQAQTVINGSFETTTASLGCNYNLSNTGYNGLMSNSSAFGVYEALDIVVNTCFVNNIPNGNYAVSLANNPSNNTQGEAISLELDAPLTIGSEYEISFQATGVQYASVTQGDLLIGVSTSPTSFGDIVDTAQTVENVWNSYTFAFTATSAASHITVMPIAGISSWNCVDDFSITSICTPTNGVDVISACESYTWTDGNTYTSNNNTATDTLINTSGCDSIVTLDLTINPLPNTNVLLTNLPTLTADQFANGYQWLNCDEGLSVVNGETNQSYTPLVTGNYAVVIDINGCIDTSACYLVDFTGIEELISPEKELVKIIDFTGREVNYRPNIPLIFIYSDGTRERVMKLEH